MATARKLPSGNYRIRVYDKKTGKYVSFTAETKKKAEKLAADFQIGAAVRASCVTVRDRAEEYIAIRDNKLSPSTIEKYRKAIDQQLSPDFVDLRIDRITDKDIIAEVNRLAGKYAPKTIRNAMNFILPIIRDERPELARHIDLPKVQKKMKEYPRAEEVMHLFRGDPYELEILLALCCSLRKEEIRGLKPADLSGNILTINRVKIDTKDGVLVKDEAKTVESRRKIELPPFLVQLYRARTGDWILATGGNALYRHYKYVMSKAGYDLCFHDLRHINASEMKLLNIPDKYAMERGGWSSDNILKSVYQSTFSDERKHFEDVINEHFSKVYDTKCDTKNNKIAQIRYFKRLR
ncbi:MAG: site-specific integrase [Ruminococcus sp.]|nr:site-specific integrase [Ruminococcus sp.]